MSRHHVVGAFFVWLGASLAAASANAQEREDLFETSHHPKESPQHFALEFRLAPYTPKIDADPALGGKNPYQTVFGSDTRIEGSLELDWQALRIPHFGTIGPGLSVGFTSMSAAATRLDNGQPSGEQTSLTIYPFYAVGVVRIDVFEREAHVPLAPYAKLGAGWALWRASNDLGTSSSGSVVGEGHTVGIHGAIGVAVQLNPLDPSAARNLDTASGINNTYLFGELMFADYTGLGQSNVLRVGTNTWVAGLAFEF